MHGVSSPLGTRQEQGKEETGHGDQLQHVPPSSSSTDRNEQMIITSARLDPSQFADEADNGKAIRATNVVLGLRRLPAGFYTVVHHSDRDWRMENKPSSVDEDAVEWSCSIPIPPDLSDTVCLEVFASFEFQPMLGTGEPLRKVTTTAGQLLDRSAEELAFKLFPQDGDVVSPCSSISIVVESRKSENNDLSASSIPALGHDHSTAASRGELEDATDHGHRALTRYRKYGEQRDLDRSIQQFERALSICPLSHPGRAAVLSNLAMAKFILCQVSDQNISLEVPLRLYRDALSARPVGHLDRPSTLIQLAAVYFAQFHDRRDHAEGEIQALLYEAIELDSTGNHEKQAAIFMLQLLAGHGEGAVQPEGQSWEGQDTNSYLNDDSEDQEGLGDRLLERFESFGDIADLEQAIAISEELVRNTSVWDDLHRTGLRNLVTASWYRFGHLGEISDLDRAVSRQREIIDLTPHGDPDRASFLSNLTISLITRFEHLDEIGDLEDAISALKDTVDLTPHNHPEKPGFLSNLGNTLTTRFERLGQLIDLEDAILRYKEAVELTPDGHSDKPAYLSNLGNGLRICFERLGELDNLEDAISMLRDAVALTPHHHPDMPGYLNNLGISFQIRFEHLGQPDDLDDAISMLKDAVDLTPRGHLDKPGSLSNLGACFVARFKRSGQQSDIDDAISMFKDAADLIPHDRPDKSTILNNLGNAFSARFERFGRPCDLEDGISRHKDAVQLTPHGHPQQPRFLGNLAASLLTRFGRLGKLSDLEDAISILRGAVDLTPDGHPEKPAYLNNLGNAFKDRFWRIGELHDLEDAILMLQGAVETTTDDHADRPGYLNNLGESFRTRFERFGQLSDLEAAISKLRNAVFLTPHDHLDRLAIFSNLGNALIDRFERLGQLNDLEEAISTLKDAVDLTPDDHLGKPSLLNNLGGSFMVRFERLDQLSDLEDAISRCREAVDLTPEGCSDKPSFLHNLSSSLVTRFERLGQLSDLEDAISMLRDAVGLTPHDDYHKPEYVSTLSNALFARFERLGQLRDLEDTISMVKDVVYLIPHDHRDKPRFLHNLGISLITRFERLEQLTDLEEAISSLKDAINLTPHDHPNKSQYLNSLGDAFAARFERFEQLSYSEQAISLYTYAASIPIGSVSVRFLASQNWISCARRISHHSLLHAYSVAISLLPKLAWIGLSLADRYSALMRGSDVVREAAAAALDLGFPETAVEWLERGRSIVWGELLHLRSSYQELSVAYPDHARRLQELSTALDHANTAREKLLSALSEQMDSAARSATDSSQRVAARHRALAIERDNLLQEIRHLPGFHQFLLRNPFSKLRTSAHSGPVVILNAAESRCDALILLSNLDHVIHVPLPNFTLKRSASLQNTMKGLVRDVRDGKVATWDRVTLESILSPLWKCVVKPVLDALAFSTPGDSSRIFWCPTGPFAFLPIHAAGLYHGDYSEAGHKVFDFVVSSYIPTLASLAPSPNPAMPAVDNLRILAVGQPPSDGQSPLPGVVTELAYIKDIIENTPSAQVILVESRVGTVEEVVEMMKDAEWVHFACHGVQDGIDSGLCLADGRRLKLRDMVALSRPRGGLAFLSACQTAKGDERMSDEAMHIAAGMLFAGYGGVIGTMWSISDGLAPRVARGIYKELFEDGTRPDYRGAARALHGAMGRLRNQGVPFVEWVPFIHVGL